MEDSQYTELKNSLSSVSAKALNFSSRLILANNLDYKQALQSRNGIARDYRGLADLMGIPYQITLKFANSENPTIKILETWETSPNATLDKLITFLEEMERHDVISEIIPFLERNVKSYLQYQRSLESPIQVAEVSPGPMNLHSENEFARGGVLTRDDLKNGECTIYDAYVSYADEDTNVIAEFAQFLESPRVGLKLFIRGRDMLAGCAELDTNFELIKNRCRRMLIFLTPNFMKSPALEFQVSFAGSLAIEQRKRILVPVILAPCEIPLILDCTSMINFTRVHVLEWTWGSLISSLMPLPKKSKDVFSSPLEGDSLKGVKMIGSSTSTDTKPIITFPATVKHSLCSIENTEGALANESDYFTVEMKDSVISYEENDSIEGKDSAISIKEKGMSFEVKNSATPAVKKKIGSNTSKVIQSSKKFLSLMAFLKGKGNSSRILPSTSVSPADTSSFKSHSYNASKSPYNLDKFTD